MEQYLFYGYLKWHDKNVDAAMKKLIKLPLSAKLLMASLTISGIVGIAFLFVNNIIAYISLGIEISLCLVTYFYSEKMFMEKSQQNYEEYKRYCESLYSWLCGFDVKEREQITELKSRFQEKQSNLKNIMKKKREKIDKWMQVFVFPIIFVTTN